MRNLIAVAAFFAGSAAYAQPVDVGTGDWSTLPEARQRGQIAVGGAVATAIEVMARERKCNVPGMGPRRVDLSVPFTLKFNSPRQVERIVIRDLGCPELETLLGRVVQRLASEGEFIAGSTPGWYRSVLEMTID
jgi:hypothetical protein